MRYYHRPYSIVVALLMCITSLVQCTATKKNTSFTKPDPNEIIFFDGFDGTALDRSKWNVIVTGHTVNHEQQAYVDTQLTISIVHGSEAEGADHGALLLRPRFSPGFVTKQGDPFDFISGRIDSRDKVEFTYGTASARIKLTDGEGLWPAWWLLGNGRWPESGEIDILEYVGEKDWASAAVHGSGYSGETPFVDRLYFPANNDVTNWHVYAVDWTPESLVFKYDGIPMFRVTKRMTEHYGQWRFDNAKFLILNFALGGAYPVKINGVQKPYFGLPDATVDLIKNNQPKMLVDWVLVTKTPGHQ